MKMEDMILISVDDHLIEPPDLFTRHVAAKYRDQAPKVITLANGEERWIFEGKQLGTVGAAAVAGRSREERHLEPANYSQLRKGCYDVHARVEDMSANGVLSSLCFATLTGFCGEVFLKGQDKQLMEALIQAYNDWHIDDWCAAYPGRFIPVAFFPLWDIDAAVKEIRRAARKGARAVTFPENAAALGLPSIHTGHWDRVFEACVEEDLVICIHIGTGGGFRFPSLDSPADVAITTMNITLADCAADLLFSPVLRKYPTLKFALSEGYMGWMPFFKERADFVYEFHRFWTGQDFGDKKPSDIIRRHFLLCFTEDPVGVKCRHDIGIEMITWECDYPHADSTWPVSPERVWPSLKDLPDNEIKLITHENAMRYFRFDPFEHIAREQATVGALRKAAAHIDVRPIAGKGGHRPGKEISGVVSARMLMEMNKQMDVGLLESKAAGG
ncbi:MAG: amidohydrolase family protein [Steroidobacteraceae bacterium]